METPNDFDAIEEDVRDRLAQEVLTRWVNPVLLARLGNGTWDEDSRLHTFGIAFPAENDIEMRVRINEEEGYWSHPRAARDIAEGVTLQPHDLAVELLPLPETPPARYIIGAFDGEHWNLDIHLNRAHPRRVDHLAAAAEFKAAAAGALEREELRAFYENAFHAAEHLAQAELLSYGPTIDEVADSRTHNTIRSAYQLWAHLGNTDSRFARLLHDLNDARSAETYLRGSRTGGTDAARTHFQLLDEMYDWVRGIVEEGRGPTSVRLITTQDIRAGQIVGSNELTLRPPKKQAT